MNKILFILFILLTFQVSTAQAQQQRSNSLEDDLDIGGDIFNDFNEDLDAAQVIEDERFYRYSRFFAVNLGLGLTTFTGNRGLAYRDNHPTLAFSLMYFMNFQNVFVMGFEFSKHTAFIDTHVAGYPDQIIGQIQTSMLRPFFGFRYYIDTSDLGTAITYSKPYFVGRIEYWYQTNTFPEAEGVSDQSEGGIGSGFGFGLEFPIEVKKTYLNIEFLYHSVNFFDKFTGDYRQIPPEQIKDPNKPSTFGYDDLTGDVLSVVVNYTISW